MGFRRTGWGYSLDTSNERAVGLLVAAALLVAFALPTFFFAAQMARIEARAELALNARIALGVSEPTSLVPEVTTFEMPAQNSDSLTGDEIELAEMLSTLSWSEALLSENDIRHFQKGDTSVYYFIRSLDSGGNRYRVYCCDVSFVSDAAKSGTAGMIALGIVLTAFVFLLGKKSKQLLREKDEAVKNFISNSSHELKTPLAIIASQVEAAQLGAIKVEESLASIQRATGRMTGIVDALMSLSRLEAGVLRATKRKYDVRESLFDAVVEMDRLFEEKGTSLEIEAEIRAPVMGDRDMLFSVFQNLLSNALRYATSFVKITVTGGDGGNVSIEIENDGISISEEDARVMFDRFAKGIGGKTGIGLALAAEYVRIHGGTIVAQPLCDGTRVVVELPTVNKAS